MKVNRKRRNLETITKQRKLSITLLVFLMGNCCSSVYVSWNLQSSPAIFGSTAYLICRITDDANSCLKSKRQWLGGPNYGPLCQDVGCGDGTKYEIMHQSNMCNYTLIINRLSAFDVECDYTCSYGVNNMRKTLKLNGEDFLYIPTEEDKYSKITVSGNVVWFFLLIKKIYPLPKCYVSFQSVNVNKSVDIITKQPGIFYTTEIHVNISMPSISGYLTVECIIGSHKINVTKQEINTSQETSLEKRFYYIGLGCGLAAVILIITIFIRRRYRQRLKSLSPSDISNFDEELKVIDASA